MKRYVESLSPSLFWDTPVDGIDEDKHKRFIINRVLERGSWEDWILTREHYTLDVIVREAQQMRSLQPKALAFIACVGDVPLESFRCYIQKQ